MSGGGVTPSPTPTPTEPNLFYRVCPVNDIATPIIVDENGEVCYVDHDGEFSVLRYNVATGVITEDASDAVMNACESFTGGGFELELSTDGSGNTVYTNGDYHIAIGQGGNIVEGEVTLFNSVDTIGINGVVQVFKDNACTKYADGLSNEVYVRVNENFGDGDYRGWGDMSGPAGQCLSIYTPTEIDPQDLYSIAAWIDFHSDAQATPFTAGDVVKCVMEEQYFHPVSNPQIIFE